MPSQTEGRVLQPFKHIIANSLHLFELQLTHTTFRSKTFDDDTLIYNHEPERPQTRVDSQKAILFQKIL